MRKIGIIAVALLGMAGLYAQEKSPSFCQYAALDDSGQKIIDARSADDETTLDMTESAADKMRLSEVLLNEAVMKKISLAANEAENPGTVEVKRMQDYLLERHLAWMDYFSENSLAENRFTSGSFAPVYAMLENSRRLDLRREAVELPYRQFKVYESVANNARVRLQSSEYKFQFGEICQEETYDDGDGTQSYKNYPGHLLPRTCHEIPRRSHRGRSYGILEWITCHDMEEQNDYFFCLWDVYGNSVAVYQIAKDMPELKISEFVSEDYIEENDKEFIRVRFKSGNKLYHQDFAIGAFENNPVSAAGNNIGRKTILDDDALEIMARESQEFFDVMVKVYSPFGVGWPAYSRNCSILNETDKYISFKIEYDAYSGGMHPYIVTLVGTCDSSCFEHGALTLEDIATKEQMPELTRLVRQALMQHFKVDTYEELLGNLWPGSEPYPTNNFYYTRHGIEGPDELHFFYNYYELGCYAIGRIDICVNWPFPKPINPDAHKENEE